MILHMGVLWWWYSLKLTGDKIYRVQLMRASSPCPSSQEPIARQAWNQQPFAHLKLTEQVPYLKKLKCSFSRKPPWIEMASPSVGRAYFFQA